MSDLRERLRDLQDHYSTSGQLGPGNERIFGEAADEIASLRAELDIQRESQSSAVAKMLEVEQSFENLKAVAGQYLAEIASLRASSDELAKANDVLNVDILRQRSDLNQLRAQLATSQELCTKFEAAVGGDVGEILSLRAKLESARKAGNQALRQWKMYADMMDGDEDFASSAEGELYKQCKASLTDETGK